jgi:osmotically-inducible protein OsmY
MKIRLKSMILCLSVISLLATCAINVVAQEKKPDAKPAKAKPAMPTSDPDIQKCIDDKLANAPSLKDKKPTVTVSGGVATITGEAKNGGAKGAATGIAKRCGAKEVKNELTVPPGAKKPTEKKTE